MTNFTPIVIANIKNEEVRKYANSYDKDKSGNIDSNEIIFLRKRLINTLSTNTDAPFTLNDCKEILGWDNSKNNIEYNVKEKNSMHEHVYYSKENTIKNTITSHGFLIKEQRFTYNDKENTVTYNATGPFDKKYTSKQFYDDAGKIYKELVDEDGDGKYDKTIYRNYFRQKINEWFGF